MTADLAAAARFERDRRLELAAGKIAQLRASVGEDGRATQDYSTAAERIAIDCQCWIAIAEWLETDRFFGFPGGVPGDTPQAATVGGEGRPDKWIGWPELEAAADRALAAVGAQCERGDVPSYEAACARRAALWAIHRKVKSMREGVDAINAHFRERRKQGAAA